MLRFFTRLFLCLSFSGPLFALELPRKAETCAYAGQMSSWLGDAVIEVQTMVTPHKDFIELRTLIQIAALESMRISIDQIDTIDLHNGTYQQMAVNYRQYDSKHVIRQHWDVYDFSWHEMGLAKAYRLQSKGKTADVDKFRRQSGDFAINHWEPAHRFDDWLKDFSQANAERRPDMTLNEVNTNFISPISLAFILIRYVRDPFTIQTLGDAQTKDTLRFVDLHAQNQGAQLKWQFPLQVSGVDIPRPVEITVDSQTHSLQSIHLSFMTGLATAEGVLTPKGNCH